MIKAQELRLGNLILDEEGNEVITSAHTINDIVKKDYYSGISITEEWLLKAGFSTKTYIEDTGLFNFWGKYLDASISYDPGSNTFYYKLSEYTSKHIMYVHQLQNIYFALKSQELTFIL